MKATGLIGKENIDKILRYIYEAKILLHKNPGEV